MKYRFYYKNPFKFYFYRILSFYPYLLEFIRPSRIKDYKQIPIIINNFNRVESLKQLINGLEKRGYFNIYIIDNLSTYPPLIAYYDTCPYKVFRLNRNIGMNALWLTDIYKKFKNDFFVYTDSDLVLLEECPDDFMLLFLDTLKEFRFASKVGFSLKIDDLPDHFHLKEEVINYEKQFYMAEQNELLYWAPIDTTFALYRPWGKRRHAAYNIEMYRTAYPYMVRHTPWYIDSSNPDEENHNYIKSSKTATYWTKRSKKVVLQTE